MPSGDSAAVDLQRDRLSPAYRRRLAQAAQLFLKWCRRRGQPLSALKTDVPGLNAALVTYLQRIYSAGRAFWYAPHTILACQTLFPELRGQLRPAWESVMTWRLMRPIRSRLPLPLGVLEAISRFAILAALTLDTAHSLLWWNFAVAIRVAFFGLLRPKELWQAAKHRVRVPGAHAFQNLNVAVLTILDPKNRAHQGRLQVRMIRDSVTVNWLSWLLADLPAESPLWLFSQYRFRKCLSEALPSF